ncbi:MAG TPA: UDP-2,3-diacylglucosamine diphosphatase [Gemmatimonadales bacterium]|nr:UDP-2,3-diacylglucosamine diphosphatase [Gemmatimonadales bacterium]
MVKYRWRSVWISDVHLGTRHAQVDALLEFLRTSRSEYLYIVGDLIDGWELRRKWFWSEAHNTLIQKLLRKQRKQTRVIYITGNHDEFLEPFLGLRFGGLKLVREAIHVGADGRRYLVVHGHQFDGLTHFNRLLERVGSRLYDWILDLNLWLNRLRRRLGLGYWSLSAYLKQRAKRAVQYVSRYETAMVHYAESKGVDGVICGHIHRAEMRRIGNLEYLNCGDWVESCTALVEDHTGHFSLIRFHESALHDPGRRARAHDPGPRGAADPLPVGT